MSVEKKYRQLRIYISESHKYNGKSLYEAIVIEAKELALAGVTVTRAILGFGSDSHIHSSKILRLAENSPIIIDIIDSKDNINKIIPFLKENVLEGTISLTEVELI